MIITSLTNSQDLAKKIARKMNVSFSKTTVSSFPDGDIYIKFNKSLKDETVVIVDTFQPDSSKVLFNILFASKTAKDLGAKKIILVAPYLAYMRQDKRFKEGECISSKIMAELLNTSIDKIITIDPHIHRYKSLNDIFTISTANITANHIIADYIKKNYENVAVIGPDWESYQWAEDISKEIGVQNTILEKTRHSSRNVDVAVKKEIDIKGKNVVIVDDIISTGNTMIKAAIKAKGMKAKNIIAIGVHGLFVEDGLKKMKKHFTQIHTTNTISHQTNSMDVSDIIINELKKHLPKKLTT